MTDATEVPPAQASPCGDAAEAYPRVRIRGRLLCVSQLHIGDGGEPQSWQARTDAGLPAHREPPALKQPKAAGEDAAESRPSTYHGVARGYLGSPPNADAARTDEGVELAGSVDGSAGHADGSGREDAGDCGDGAASGYDRRDAAAGDCVSACGHDNDDDNEGDAGARRDNGADPAELPYIPGSTLRGALRRLLDLPDLDQPGARPLDPLVRCLFGYVEAAPEPGAGTRGADPDVGGFAGRLRCCDAPLCTLPAASTGAEPPPFWCAARHTAAVQGIAIDARTGTASHRLLYSHEIVPAGSAFRVELEADGLTREQLQKLLGLLRRLDGTLAAAIGSKAGKGWGRVRWDEGAEDVQVITPAGLADWLTADGAELPFRRLADLDPGAATAVAPDTDPRPLRLSLQILADGPVLVNEPGYRRKPDRQTNAQQPAAAAEAGAAAKSAAAEDEDKEHPPQLEHSRRPDGTAIIPGKSLVGALRARAERILATMAHRHFDAAPGPARQAAQRLAQRLFGSESRRGALWLADAVDNGDTAEHDQRFIAIDRFSGAVKGSHGEGALFRAKARSDGSYSTEVLLETHRLRHLEGPPPAGDWWKGLLWLLAQDAADGELRVGWGKAKGYGTLRLAQSPEALWVAAGAAPADPTDWLAALCRALHETLDALPPQAALDTAAAAQTDPAPAPKAPAPATSDTETAPGTDAPPAAAVSDLEPITPGSLPAAETPPRGKFFHPPYVFLPATGLVNGAPVRTLAWDAARSQDTDGGAPVPTRHDLWLTGHHSGHIDCRLELKTPAFVGARQHGGKNESKRAEPYMRGCERAIPGNSLRGMIASIAEAISQSALRVLEDRYYSVRKDYDEVQAQSAGDDPSWHKGKLYGCGDDWRVTPHPGNGQAPRVQLAAMQRLSRLWVERVRKKEVHKQSAPWQVREHAQKHADHTKPNAWRPPSPGNDGWSVWFATTADGAEVAELSFSKVWRQEVPGTLFDFVTDPPGTDADAPGAGQDLLPWGSPNAERTGLTPAEALFGVVEAEKQGEQAAALASRVRFYDALAPTPGAVPCYQEDHVLRILSTPKPPSPMLYFHPRNKPGKPVHKRDLHPQHHRINGRKRYVPHPKAQTHAEFWRSRDTGNKKTTAKQKIICRPMKAGAELWFRVEFDNLRDDELTLLCTALAPGQGFRHGLGLGKPLGLGAAAVDIAAVMLTDHGERYGTDACRDGRRWYCEEPARPPDLPARLHPGLQPPQQGGWRPLADILPADPLTDPHGRLIDAETLRQLRHIGNPGALLTDTWVLYPLLAQQLPAYDVSAPNSKNDQSLRYSEHKTYQWFVHNDQASAPQCMHPVLPDRPLPTLRAPAPSGDEPDSAGTPGSGPPHKDGNGKQGQTDRQHPQTQQDAGNRNARAPNNRRPKQQKRADLYRRGRRNNR
ncbi:RAMP superfamily CRISPR-associated protein [uncultured Thiohalocapsa sp.]|uniref:RAMP superfamily CRISPR-associated protein n=1 Tax=uncultured Thiohalocapsa sp. TaxID=768990 RepID=UPI0025DE82E0|nr:RAMP superfamily CRISPR-associated protein [uncultured Thiohalocapsa sp.]